MTPEVLVVIVVINALATFSIWRWAAHKPSLPKKKFYRELTLGKPIVPKHERPKNIGDNFPTLADDEDRQFFNDFSRFADVVNWWLADANSGSRWRLQELPDTKLKIGFMDSPVFGRRYAVFCGPIKLGIMEIQAGFKYSAKNKTVRLTIQLMWVRLLEFESLMDFFNAILIYIADDDENSRGAAQQFIDSALTRALWNSLTISDDDFDGATDWGNLEVMLQGCAPWYFARRDCEAFRKMDAAAISAPTGA